MKPLAQFRKAAALPFVLLLVALNVIVVVALMVYATTELQASRNSGQAEVARAIAQSGIDIAAGLIAANSTNNGFVSYQRVTNVGGDWRLETKIGNVTAPDSSTPWKTAATNPAVLHSGFASGTDGVDLNFAVRGDAAAGFIAPRVNANGWTNLSTNMFRMDWIYVYKGTNLVGRVAYWADDESTKLNFNYSGTQYEYNTNNFDLPGKSVSINFQSSGWNQQLNGSIWPLSTELGGIAGLSRTNAYSVIIKRGECWTSNFSPYPSVLGLRIGTIGSLGGLAVTNLLQQSSLGFTATVYTREEERSYAKGLPRYNLGTNLVRGSPTNQIASLVSAISSNNPEFANKYNLPAFALAAFTFGQWANYPTTNYGSTPLFVRGLPLMNEVSFKATAWNAGGAGGTNYLTIQTDVEIVELHQTGVNLTNAGTNLVTWGDEVGMPGRDKLKAYVEFPGPSAPVFFGTSLTATNLAYANATNTWFQPYYAANNVYTYYGPGPSLSVSNWVASMSGAYSTNTTNSMGALTSPTNVVVRMEYNGYTYQSSTLSLPLASIPAPGPNQTNIYHFVAQPRGDLGYRGDPRFTNSFIVYTAAVTNTDISGLYPSIGQPNTINATNGSSTNANWKLDEYGSDSNSPDIVYSYLLCQDRGLPNITQDPYWQSGFASRLVGVGWIGEVPVTTASGNALGFSTPRLWGNGRSIVNAQAYPPDWLLMDSFHFALPTNSIAGIYSTCGRVNVNNAKTFFQMITGNTTHADTIMDSVTINARTKDWITAPGDSLGTGVDVVPATNSSRASLLWRMKQMAEQRNAANNPYVNHFEFLADLAATNLYSTNPSDPNYGTTNPSWWYAPSTSNGSIYAATNTTDRRIESIVRSLNQKLTTHGNQFSIFSLGQALRKSTSGSVSIPGMADKFEVVGESYLQSVYERAPQYDEATGAITNGTGGAPPMRQLYLRELRY